MALIRCLAIVSTVGIAIVIILATQLASSGNNIYLGVVIALSVVCCISLILLLFKLLQAQRRLRKLVINGDPEKGGQFNGLEVEEEDEFLRALSGVPTKLNFKELEIATRGFCKLLGQGGFGCVYEGELADGTKVAVKRLETESKMRSKEFCAEVVTISGIHHINLVRLLGFCAEGNHRLLVYEYMENGSLDRWLFQKRMRSPICSVQEEREEKLAALQDEKKYMYARTEEKIEGESLLELQDVEKRRMLPGEEERLNSAFQNEKEEKTKGLPALQDEKKHNLHEEEENVKKNRKEKEILFRNKDGEQQLSWMVRFRIALQTARALAYLHEECRETILHLDVKPQNILLDSKFHSKVSDFGLSRAINRDQSRLVTSMRGTPGYLAPEWLINAGVTHKSDVYSYGMVLLELVSGRRNVDHSQDSEAWYFPTVAFQCAQENRMEEIIDPALRKFGMSKDEMDESFLAIRVAFWCIQDQVAARPSMTSVVRMLEGSQAVGDPPLQGVFSFTNVLVQGGGGGVNGVLAGVPFLNSTLQQDKKVQQQDQQHQQINKPHPHPMLHTEEPLSISLDSSTPDSPLPTPTCQ